MTYQQARWLYIVGSIVIALAFLYFTRNTPAWIAYTVGFLGLNTLLEVDRIIMGAFARAFPGSIYARAFEQNTMVSASKTKDDE